uniref:ATP synthase subunit a n=1 Tax=Tropidomya abbreviata TaxID=102404 RepID=A0A1U9XPK4_9BIVA|nr:ATP synthase F0 subunit 6 [Tropidomya abbreviata]AQZ26178.1 ATP synthase subunit 6 [Tropidomya abbreviata]
MSTDLFSSFDDINFCLWGSHMNYFISAVPMFIFVFGVGYFSGGVYRFMFSLLDSLTKKSFLSGVELMMPCLFIFMLFMNLSGLIPYGFSWTSHFAITYGLAIPFWLGLIMSSVLWNWSLVSSGLLPYGVKGLLAVMMVWVEIVSNLARPLFLGMRLTVNMMVGQVILGLSGSILSSLIVSGYFVGSGIVLVVMLLLIVLEIGVAVIQAYLFCFLLTVYIDEYSV